MPSRASKGSKETAVAKKTLIIDNGAYTIKAGFAPSDVSALDASTSCHVIPNCIAKLPSSKHIHVGSQLSNCKDFAEMVFRRPLQKGQLVNWETEREIWGHSFFDDGAQVACDPSETNLILTEAPNGLSNLQSNADQIVFEEFEFAAYRRVAGPILNAYNDVATVMGDPPGTDAGEVGHMAAECVLVVDSGYSHTTVTPVFRGRPIQQAVRRLEIGGKFLTNYLKDVLSLRQLELTNEFHIVNEMKQDVCFVTDDLNRDLERTWKHGPRYGGRKKPRSDVEGMEVDGAEDQSIILDYVLPDYTTRFRGEARPHEAAKGKVQSKLQQPGSVQDTIVTLGNERFSVPELMFSPSNVGLAQAGLPEVIMQSVRAVPPGLWTAMLSNVLVVGGNSLIKGFTDRLYTELRPLVPIECVVRVKQSNDPIKSTWTGGARLAATAAKNGILRDVLITRQDYQEHGEHWVMRQFTNERPLPP